MPLGGRAGGGLAVMADDSPVNLSSGGTLCVKGRFGTGFVHSGDRITTPMVKRDGRWHATTWDEALDTAAEGFARNRGHFGALASAKATNEDGYVIQKLTRVVMGTNNIDDCTRLCHSPSVEAMLVSMGSGATSNSYQDYEEAGCLMVVGADASANHPVIAIRFRRAVAQGARLIVVNPKRVELCDQADLWIRQNPGTDVALFNAMARVILDEGLDDREFVRARTENFEDWLRALEPYTLDYAERVTGVPRADIAQAARWYARPAFTGSCLIWGMGITQHVNGTSNAHAVLNLSLVAGQMGFAGSGISPLRGQNNVQGAGDAGCVPTNLPGYAGYGAADLDRFERCWGRPPPSPGGRPPRPGPLRVVDPRGVGWAHAAAARVRGRGFRRPPPCGDFRRGGPPLAERGRHVLRAARERRPPVAVPDPRPSGHAVPLCRLVSARQGAVRPGHPGGPGRPAAGPRLPLPAQHRPAALPLARRHHDPPGGGAARAGPTRGDCGPPGRRPPAGRRRRRGAPGGVPAGRSGRPPPSARSG